MRHKTLKYLYIQANSKNLKILAIHNIHHIIYTEYNIYIYTIEKNKYNKQQYHGFIH